MNLQQLADKIVYLEQEVNTIRKELADLRQQREAVPQVPATQSIDSFPWMDKTLLRRAMDKLFQTLSIQGEPIGVEALRQMMKKENLNQNELSRSIIEARDE
jgi:hypothetical protein